MDQIKIAFKRDPRKDWDSVPRIIETLETDRIAGKWRTCKAVWSLEDGTVIAQLQPVYDPVWLEFELPTFDKKLNSNELLVNDGGSAIDMRLTYKADRLKRAHTTLQAMTLNCPYDLWRDVLSMKGIANGSALLLARYNIEWLHRSEVKRFDKLFI